MDQFLSTTKYFDFDHPLVVDFAERHTRQDMTRKQMAIALYYAVRDAIRYNPYKFDGRSEHMRASHCLEQGESYCIPKAVLLGALARYFGIPSRLGLADVRNHLSSPALLEWLRTDVFAMHGYIELYLDHKWVKATPAFNLSLCEKMGVKPLEFDGETDSIFQAFNTNGARHMEYLKDHGTFADVPFELIKDGIHSTYPHLVDRMLNPAHRLEDEI